MRTHPTVVKRTVFATVILLGLAVPAPADAAAQARLRTPSYDLVDVGTFGGPHADVTGPARQITGRGAVLGMADTPVRDADSPNDGMGGGDPYIFHAFKFENGRLHDLGALRGNNSSSVFEINRNGLGVGASETGTYDPRSHAPSFHPVVFRDGTVTDIGTLPGGTEGFAVSVNDSGQVVGLSNSARRGPGQPDFFDWGGQIRSFIWQHGVMRDLGTLGGPGTTAGPINARGQVSGDSYVDDVIDPNTGFPTLHPFIWQDGRMRDLGSLGGGITRSFWMNERGQVVGFANLAGDKTAHPFLWDGRKLIDLGTLGGAYAEADRINDRGVVTGFSRMAGEQTIHTFMWRHGVMTDLSASAGQCTYPEWINNRDEIVGATCDGAALIWHNDRQYDLNTLVTHPEVQLTTATFIDDRGQIVALGKLANGDQHVFLLRPRSNR